MRPLLLALLAGGSLASLPLHAPQAHAYPTSVIACPTGEVQAAGEANAFLYDAYYPSGFQVWGGVNLGLGGAFDLGSSGLSFGGFEVGVDGIGASLAEAAPRVLLSAKAQLLVESDGLPALSLGLLGLNPLQGQESLNLAFCTATKTLAWGATDLGRLSAGVGTAALRASTELFSATAPFAETSTALLLGGYESPALGPCSLAIDHMGGLSDYGGTNVALNVRTAEGTYATVGYAFGNDTTSASPPGPFLCFSTTFGPR